MKVGLGMRLKSRTESILKLVGLVFVLVNLLYCLSLYFYRDDVHFIQTRPNSKFKEGLRLQYLDRTSPKEHDGTVDYEKKLQQVQAFCQSPTVKDLVSQHSWLDYTTLKVNAGDFLNDSISPDAWANKNTLYYDPRLTLSLYYSYIGSQIKKNPPKLKEIEIPFHWADWTNLTSLNDELSLPISKRKDCSWVLNRSDVKSRLGIKSINCLDHNALTMETVQQLGYDSLDQMPGFLFYQYPRYRTYNDIRIAQGKSHIFSFLELPTKLVFLSKSGDGTEVKVERSNRRGRIIQTGLMNQYMSDRNIKVMSSSIPNIELDPIKEAKKMRKIVDSYSTPLAQSESSKEWEPEIQLKEGDFKYSALDYSKQMSKVSLESPNEQLDNTEEPFYDAMVRSTKYNGRMEPTYFLMSTMFTLQDKRNVDNDFGWHYDWRFFNGALNYAREGWTQKDNSLRTKIILERLLRNWFRFTQEKRLVSWIMHGPLLGWYWNGQMFPYDNDLDVQMPVMELLRLGKEYNQTLVIEDPEEGFGRYLIDVGTFIFNRDISRTGNHIDARFIDIDSGIYIDITGLSTIRARIPIEYARKGLLTPSIVENASLVVNDRRKHFYTLEQISPLRKTLLNGVPVFIPNQLLERLTYEYPKGLTSLNYKDWYFIRKLGLWLQTDDLYFALNNTEALKAPTSLEEKIAFDRTIENMSDEMAYKLMHSEDSIFYEFCKNAELKSVHEKELNILFEDKITYDGNKTGTQQVNFDDDPNARKDYRRLASKEFHIRSPRFFSLFQLETNSEI